MIPESAPPIDSVEEFARVLELGLGRAILFLRDRDAAPYRDAILNACLHYTGYDWQIEGTRTGYLYDVLLDTGDPASFVRSILAALGDVTNFRDADQLFRLVGRIAEDGHRRARAALYERFDRDDLEERFLGSDAIVNLDGIDGFLHVAERMGAAVLDTERPLDSDDEWKLSSAVRDAEEEYGVEAVEQALGQACTDHPGLQAFVKAVTGFRAEEESSRASRDDDPAARAASKRLKRESATYEQVRQVIYDPSSHRFNLRDYELWGRDARIDDLTRAATDLLSEQDEKRLERYLRIFGMRAFPLALEPLLELVQHPNERVMFAVTTALSQMNDSRVRALALELIADPAVHGWQKSRGIDILLSTFEPGDEALLLGLLENPRTREEYHSVGFSSLDVLEPHLSEAAAPCLLALYEHGPCTQCRRRTLELLQKIGKLPAWLLQEATLDASADVCETAETIARGEVVTTDRWWKRRSTTAP